MPLYDYLCEHCDHRFSSLRPLAEYREPSNCPICGQLAERVVSAPRLNTMQVDRRRAYQLNERSAHEPRMSHHHNCGAGCPQHHKPKQAGTPKTRQQGGKRPWMLGH